MPTLHPTDEHGDDLQAAAPDIGRRRLRLALLAAAPLTVTISPQSQQGNAGQEVNFHIVAQDPDAKIDRCVVVDFGDGQTSNDCPPAPTCQAPYGPWTPPAKAPDRYELDIKHTYATARANPYVASFQLQSYSFCSPDPYGDAAQAPAQVTVS